MNPLRRTVRAVKAAAVGVAVRFAGAGRSGWSMLLRGTRYDYKSAVGDGLGNSALAACLLWLVRTFPEAPIRVNHVLPDGTQEPVPAHEMTRLIKRPNEIYSGLLLWMATLISYSTDGNAYWLKVRNGQGKPIQLWYVPHWMIEPKWPQDGSVFISHYDYKPNSTPIRVEVRDVVHFRFGLDPNNQRKGLSPIASVLREVFSDDEAANFSGALLRNMGVPGAIIAPDTENATLGPGDAQVIKAEFQQRFGGDNRGDVMVMPAKTKFQMVSFSPEQMDMKALRRLPEERIAAVLGIPAGVVGLGAGLDRNTYSNVEEGRRAAYESNILPTQRVLAAELEIQLLDDFEPDTTQFTIDFDLSGVSALQESQDKLWARADLGVRGGWLTVAQAKHIVGMKPDAGDEYYLRSLVVQSVPAEQASAPREPIARTANPAPTDQTATAAEVEQSAPTLRPGSDQPKQRFLAERVDGTSELTVWQVIEPVTSGTNGHSGGGRTDGA